MISLISRYAVEVYTGWGQYQVGRITVSQTRVWAYVLLDAPGWP
jgi:hypothetical protein